MKTFFIKIRIDSTANIADTFRLFQKAYPDLDVQAIEELISQ